MPQTGITNHRTEFTSGLHNRDLRKSLRWVKRLMRIHRHRRIHGVWIRRQQVVRLSLIMIIISRDRCEEWMIVVKIHREFLERVRVRRGKGQEVVHFSRVERERKRDMNGEEKERSLRRLIRKKREIEWRRDRCWKTHKRNESKCCWWLDASAYGDTHHTIHTRRETKSDMYIWMLKTHTYRSIYVYVAPDCVWMYIMVFMAQKTTRRSLAECVFFWERERESEGSLFYFGVHLLSSLFVTYWL